MTAKMKDVRGYLEELERLKEGKPDQVREGIETYIELWKKALERGVVNPNDGMPDALAKIDEKGGLYKATEDS